MNRRTVLSTLGLTITGAAGCSGTGTNAEEQPTTGRTTTVTTTTPVTTTETLDGPKHGDELPADDDPTDGYPPEFETQPDERSFDDSYFGSRIQNGQQVELASTDVCYYWYARGEARFVDARGAGQYANQYIFGAVNSPAEGETAAEGDDPVTEWPTDDRIVCYCGCPHHLSSLRAADLLDNGYENVYVLDEGYWKWHNRGYPRTGDNVDSRPNSVTLVGVAGAQYAGKTAWAIQESTEQIEATPIEEDGRYEMELKFEGVTANTPIRVETPAYDVRAPLGELTDGVITGAGSY